MPDVASDPVQETVKVEEVRTPDGVRLPRTGAVASTRIDWEWVTSVFPTSSVE
jgi:hypothetical protein